MNLEFAYQKALRFTKSHYENFPVISLFIPRKLRKHVAVIYQFARQADDIADEGKLAEADRLDALCKYENDFIESSKGNPANEFWAALTNTIYSFNLNEQNFLNLLEAFNQDVKVNSYQTFEEVLKYCEYSANPVGRLILELFDIRNPGAKKYSDKICTALQLTNFYQDLSIDLIKNRLYIPIQEMRDFGVNEKDFLDNRMNENIKSLIKFQTERAQSLFDEGKNLLTYLKGTLKYEISWTILGGECILRKIKEINYNVLDFRPTISKVDALKLITKTIRQR